MDHENFTSLGSTPSTSVGKVLNGIASNFVDMKTYYSVVDTENLKGFYKFVLTKNRQSRQGKRRRNQHFATKCQSWMRNLHLFNC